MTDYARYRKAARKACSKLGVRNITFNAYADQPVDVRMTANLDILAGFLDEAGLEERSQAGLLILALLLDNRELVTAHSEYMFGRMHRNTAGGRRAQP